MPSAITEFFKDRSVLITGSTGFMGKVLVEKLLRVCPGIKSIFLLIRPKTGQEIKQRLEEMLNSKLFDRIHKDHPETLNKLVPIMGDMMEAELGISQSDSLLLLSTVSIVFHAAATVKFDEALKYSVQMNVIGTQKLVNFCHKMTNLVALIHVSTAYANCDRTEIPEAVYTPPLHPNKLVEALEWMDEDIIKAITPQLIAQRPNTYTFTKALAEYILLEEGGSLPIAIVRPSIVGAAWKEPVPGWIDNYNGPSGLLGAIGKGLLRTMIGNVNSTADVIPVDVAINLIVAAAWYTAVHRPNSILVYNCTSGNINKVTWGQIERMAYTNFMKNPLENVFRIPNPRFTSSRCFFRLKAFIDHLLPAYFLDILARLFGQPPRLIKLYDKIHSAVKSLDYFTSHQWDFINDNTVMLMNKLSSEDKKIFYFDLLNLHWLTYFENYCLGIKRYLFKEELSHMPEARKHIRRLQQLTLFTKFLSAVLVWRWLMGRFAVARQIWHLVISIALHILKALPIELKS